MLNNDILRSVRFMLDISDTAMAEIVALGGLEVPASEVTAYLAHDTAPGYVECSNAVMAHFLDGLIVYRRGRDESRDAARWTHTSTTTSC